MAKSHSVVCKMVLIVAIAVVANLLSFSAGQAAVPSPPDVQYPECNSSPTIPECDTCCRKAGHPGGYVKGDQCICNSG
ncbi:hypothetical protein GQ55_8G241800 [Panicum hallii var. hallii]|uniref:Invertebrate defensins family profile domain-containing protein n=1 Tax=Panicum hallii var. hallii TaxID=1504633 RepID=A0A2T7CQM4_9POAL|nr:hypothetical protein GQ55_8G241800 [Panicum hallii var. hallii]